MRLTPKDVAILLDRVRVLFDKSSRISEGRDLTVRSELPIDALNQVVELTPGEGTATDITAAGKTTGRLAAVPTRC